MNPDHMGNNLSLQNKQNNHEDHEKEKKEKNDLWEKSKENFTIQELMKGKSLQEIMDEISNLREAFEKELDTIVCSDERVPATEGTKIGIAGQLILGSPKEVKDFIERCKGRIKRVESHSGCGAAGIKFDELKDQKKWEEFKNEYGLQRENVTDVFENGDTLGKWWSKEIIVKELSDEEKGFNVEYSHTTKEKMTGDVHDARVIYFDGTGKFNPTAIEGMPVGYTCSGADFGLSDEYLKKEIQTLCGGIALKEEGHGFGERFNGDDDAKFYIFVSAKDQEQLDRLMKVANEAVAEYNNKVEVKGFIPKVKADEPEQ
ncbi:MAG: hypothetical protein ABIC82_02330 [bacterium]